MKNYDVIIIGGGPGGYVAAIRASQLGLNTALVERERLGGVCLNWGCIPTKALLRNAEVVGLLGQGRTYGFDFDMGTLKIDYSQAQKRSRVVSARLSKGVEYLMKKNKVEVYSGNASIKDQNHVIVQPGEEALECKNIIIATGSRPVVFPDMEADGERILTSREALELKQLPSKILIVGAGAIGMEFAYLWRVYGAEITVLEMKERVLPLEDEEISMEVEKQFKKAGINIHTEAKLEVIDKTPEGVILHLFKPDCKESLSGDKVLLAAGVRPNTENIGLEALGVETERGFILIDDQMKTNIPGVYAIGDVTGKLPLAHTASAQGIIAAETIAGREPQPLKYEYIPRCTYSHPETASTGLTESQAKEKGYEVRVGKFPFRANGKAMALDEPEGFVKIVADRRSGKILGVHMVGPLVTELVAGPAGVINLDGTLSDLCETVHPHPTLSEIIMEAAHVAEGAGIHI